jgi:hypothetical protein
VGWVSDPHHFNADPGTAFHSNADSDLAFHFKEDPDPAPATTSLKALQALI